MIAVSFDKLSRLNGTMTPVMRAILQLGWTGQALPGSEPRPWLLMKS